MFMLKLLVASLILLPSIAGPLEYRSSQSSQGNPFTIKISVDLVVLHATVRNRKGKPVSGLVQDDFQVYENGVIQAIKSYSHEDIPVTVGLVVDNSGSMIPKRTEVVLAALAFARSSNPEDQMFVVNFNETVSLGLPSHMPFTDKTSDLQAALGARRATGKTALYDAIAAALQHLEKGNRDKKVLIVVSDGGDNASKCTLDQIMAMAGKSDAIIYTLGIFEPVDPDHNTGVLKKIAMATGGEAFLPESLKEIVPICEQIAREIRTQYTIAYAPTNELQDGSYRHIAVKAEAQGRGRLSVRTRTGYIAPLRANPLPPTGVTPP
jgi:Ca-activated chloride channel homolog